MWCYIMKYLPQPACVISFLQVPALWILWGYAWEVLFLSSFLQSSPAFGVAGQATLMILISQGAWIQTGILPLQLLLNIWCSSLSTVCLSHYLSLSLSVWLCFFTSPSFCSSIVSFPPSLSRSVSLALLLFPLRCLHWEIIHKGLPSLSTSSSNVFFQDIYCTVQFPGCRCVPVCWCCSCCEWSCMST